MNTNMPTDLNPCNVATYCLARYPASDRYRKHHVKYALDSKSMVVSIECECLQLNLRDTRPTVSQGEPHMH